MNLSLIASLFVAGVFFSLVAHLAIEHIEGRMARKRLQREEGVVRVAQTSLIDTLFRPFFKLYAPMLKRFKLTETRANLDKKFSYAALEHYTHEDFWAFQIFTSFLFVLFLYLVVFELRLLDLNYSIPWWVAIFSMAFGFWFPNIWLNSLIKSRQREIIFLFPSFVDNLTLTVEAGLDFIAAVNRITQKMGPSPLKEELSQMLSEIQLGASRAQALKKFGQRIGLSEISTFISVLVQADRLGTSIGRVLRVQAERIRRQRFEAAEKKGALASQKLLFPLVIFIMPAVFIVVFVLHSRFSICFIFVRKILPR